MSLPQPPHLPAEIWLHILSFTSPEASTTKTLWLSLRPLSLQLKPLVEKHFLQTLLPLYTLRLSITLPSYDQRNPLQGHAIFLPENFDDEEVGWFRLKGTEPEHFYTQFLSRWEGMKDSEGRLKEGLWWEVEFGGKRVRIRLRVARVEGDGERVVVGFGWRGMVEDFCNG